VRNANEKILGCRVLALASSKPACMGVDGGLMDLASLSVCLPQYGTLRTADNGAPIKIKRLFCSSLARHSITTTMAWSRAMIAR
jgi:hypothetical protein